MADPAAEHWVSINWPTVIAAVTVITPIFIGLFKLIAAHSREDLTTERDAHEKTKTEKHQLANEAIRLQEQINALTARLDIHDQEEPWQDVDLTDEEETILIAISMDELNSIYSSQKISCQRISLALDRLEQLDFIRDGTEGPYALPIARQWLDEEGLLD